MSSHAEVQGMGTSHIFFVVVGVTVQPTAGSTMRSGSNKGGETHRFTETIFQPGLLQLLL